MKKVLLQVVFLLLLSGFLKAQIVYDNYQDGKIWFKLKQGQPTSVAWNHNSYNVSISDIPVVETLNKVVSVKKIYNPFHAVNNYPALRNVYLLELTDPTKINVALEMLEINTTVEYAEKVPLDKTMAAPNDPSFGSQWELNLINATQAWAYPSVSSNIKVAVVDDAIQNNAIPLTHEDLYAAIWKNPGEPITSDSKDNDNNGYVDDIRGYDVSLNKWQTDPPSGDTRYRHGTQVAGVIGAVTNNSIGIASIGNRIKIIPVKASNSLNAITNGYEGVVYAAVAGANVICMAWGTSVSSVTGQNVMNYAHAQGCVLVAAAGNDNTNAMYYPAAYNHVIAVAATQSNDVKAPFSNYGSWVDVSAPGVNVYTTTTYTTTAMNRYAVASGTSISAGLVAGLAGLMLTSNPGATPDEIEGCIRSSSVNTASLNPTTPIGNGRIDAVAAMGCISANQYLTPIADFRANTTNIFVGGKVVFANTTVHDGTSYTWTFQGGSPSTAVKTDKSSVEVTYLSAGLYSVTLVATRTLTPTSADTVVKTNYISVGGGGGCDTLNLYNTYSADPWIRANYYHGPLNDTDAFGVPIIARWGWINGVNKENQFEKAQYFDITGSPRKTITSVRVHFAEAKSASGVSPVGKFVSLIVYELGVGGLPGNEKYRKRIEFPDIINDVAAGRFTTVKFDSAVTVTTDNFFVSIALMGGDGNLEWSALDSTRRDTLNILSNKTAVSSQTNPSEVYQRHNNGSWCRIDQGCGNGTTSWAINISLYIFPFMTDQPVDAYFTMDHDTICEGNYIVYDATGSTHQDTVSWIFQGGNPSHSNKLIDTVFYVNKPFNNIYTDTTTLIVRGGGCIDSDTMVKTFKVFSSPRITVTSNPVTSICVGGGASVTATASASVPTNGFTWSPSHGLSSNTDVTVIISPTATQTYEIEAVSTSYGCHGNTTIMVEVDQSPSANTVISPNDTVCVGDDVIFDGSSSIGNTYSWNAPGAATSSSSAAIFTTSYSIAGTYSYTLQATNACGTSPGNGSLVVITCTPNAVPELFSKQNVTAFYNSNSNAVDLSIYIDNSQNNVQVKLLDALGQYVVAKQVSLNKGISTFNIDVTSLARGVYTIQVTDNKTSSYASKLVIY